MPTISLPCLFWLFYWFWIFSTAQVSFEPPLFYFWSWWLSFQSSYCLLDMFLRIHGFFLCSLFSKILWNKYNKKGNHQYVAHKHRDVCVFWASLVGLVLKYQLENIYWAIYGKIFCRKVLNEISLQN